jgi:tellurium resistance protein TerD
MIASNMLYKGQILNLSDKYSRINEVGIGFGWQMHKNCEEDLEVEVFSFLLDINGRVPANEFVVFYGSELITESINGARPYSADGALIGSLISNSKEKNGDHAQIYLTLENVREDIVRILIALAIIKYPNDSKKDKKSLAFSFSKINGLYSHGFDYKTGKGIFINNINVDFNNEDVIEIGEFIRQDGGWVFKVLGEAYDGGIIQLITKYTR